MPITLDMYDACGWRVDKISQLVKSSVPSDFYFSYNNGYPIFALRCYIDSHLYSDIDFAGTHVRAVFIDNKVKTKQQLLDMGFVENNSILRRIKKD